MPAELATTIAGLIKAEPRGDVVARALDSIRTHLGMDVAFVSEIVGDRVVFRTVDAPGLGEFIKPGDSHALDDVFCGHILAGRLPELMPDTAAEPLAAAMPGALAIPIGRHMSVPLRRADGSTYGMFCCLGQVADPTLSGRDLAMMRVFADLAEFEINREHAARAIVDDRRNRITSVMSDDAMTIVYQPIWNLVTMAPVGCECLSRFASWPSYGPDHWFAEAAAAGLGTALEIAAIHRGLAGLAAFPDMAYLSVNASPATVLSGELDSAFAGVPVDRIVLEITEHDLIVDYSAMTQALRPLRRAGLRLAVDDAGAGYASLHHILDLRPDLIKLDMHLTRGIDEDRARQALTGAIAGFARDIGSLLIAEGVETSAELATLRALGIELAQGYHLGRPMPLDHAAALFENGRPALAAA
ncbi:EAL domain-containing protein [Polymorphobacter sp. PAMC 29334]|uniref:sensor domain-containing phosphodiesterase n=1 Tax=Polymorphobacter sp. PAMC 29334 TaxID=2862331 RepID=UPI001C783342|nr:EAL domain-containing protein [Polymorphobacter sp. PAMC 29334]QYE35511.1 EAL domain-containing protein [Polymorphobacter sp. PAMC 29334]